MGRRTWSRPAGIARALFGASMSLLVGGIVMAQEVDDEPTEPGIDDEFSEETAEAAPAAPKCVTPEDIYFNADLLGSEHHSPVQAAVRTLE